MRIQKMVLLAMLGVLVLALGGCGSDSDNSSNNDATLSDISGTAGEAAKEATAATGSGGALALAADPNGDLKFDKTSLDGTAGNVDIKFTNDSSTPHNVTVEDSSDKELGATKDLTGASETLKLSDVKAGSYTFYCSIPGHEAAGMKGTLTVK